MKASSVSSELSKRLTELGIPPEQQDASSLSNLFPSEFKVADFDLPERLAEILSGHECALVRRNEVWDEVRPGSGVEVTIEVFQKTQSQ